MGLWSSIGGGIGSAIGSIWGPAGAAIGQQAGSDMGQIGDYFQNRHDARDAASRANGYMLYMQNTAHQREIADLRAAGLNPVLSGMGGTGAGFGSVPVNSAYNRDYNDAAEAEGYASARRIREQNEREKALNQKQIELLDSQAEKTNQEAFGKSLENRKLLKEVLNLEDESPAAQVARAVGASERMVRGISGVSKGLSENVGEPLVGKALGAWSAKREDDLNKALDEEQRIRLYNIQLEKQIKAMEREYPTLKHQLNKVRDQEAKEEMVREWLEKFRPKETIIVPTSGKDYWSWFGDRVHRKSFFKE